MKLRNKLFLGLIATQTIIMLLFLSIACYKLYSKHLLANIEYSDAANDYLQKRIINLIIEEDSYQIDQYLDYVSTYLNMAKENIVQKIEVKNSYSEVIGSKEFMPYKKDKKGLIPTIVKSILGENYNTKDYIVNYNNEQVGTIKITITNRILINTAISIVRAGCMLWLLIFIVTSIVYYAIINYLTKNVTALNKIIDNLANEKYDMSDIKLVNKSDEISQLVSSIKYISSDIVKQTKINRKLNLQKSILLSNISNNMLTPLNGIFGAVNLLRSDIEDKKSLDSIRFIENSSKILLNQLTNILTYMEIKESDSELRLSACMMSDLVYSCYQTAVRNIEDNPNVEINYINNISEDSNHYVNIDIAKLQTVLSNIIENAIDFTNKGKINVVLDGISLDNKSIKYHVSVEDTGSGMDSKKLAKLEETLNHTDEELETKGHGLGLVISNLILRKMDGNLKIASTLNKGTRVDIDIVTEKAPISRVL